MYEFDDPESKLNGTKRQVEGDTMKVNCSFCYRLPEIKASIRNQLRSVFISKSNLKIVQDLTITIINNRYTLKVCFQAENPWVNTQRFLPIC